MRAIATSLVLGLSLWALPAAGQQAASAGFTADTSGVSVDGGGSGPDEGIPGSLVVGGE